MIGVKAQVRVPGFFEAADKQASDDEQHERAANLGDNQRGAEAVAGGGGSAAAFVEDFVQTAAGSAESRRDANEDAGEDRSRESVGKDAPIKTKVENDGQNTVKGNGAHRTGCGDSEDNSTEAAKDGEQKTFGEQLANQAAACGAERSAHGHFVAAGCRASEAEVGDVQAGKNEESSGKDQKERADNGKDSSVRAVDGKSVRTQIDGVKASLPTTLFRQPLRDDLQDRLACTKLTFGFSREMTVKPESFSSERKLLGASLNAEAIARGM